MKYPSLLLSLLGSFLFLSDAPLLAADTQKVKVIDKFDRIDPKTVRFGDARGKLFSTPDPNHPKVMEVTMDYAKPGGTCGFSKTFPEGTARAKKHSAIRFWVRSNCGTGFGVNLGGNYTRKDDKRSAFGAGGYTATETWTMITIPFNKVSRHGYGNFWKDGKWHASPRPKGGDPMDEDDIDGLESISFSSDVNKRGTSTVGHLMLDGLELLER